MTVAELIERLSALDPTLRVGTATDNADYADHASRVAGLMAVRVESRYLWDGETWEHERSPVVILVMDADAIAS